GSVSTHEVGELSEETRTIFPLRHADRVVQERLYYHVHIQDYHLPVTRCDFCLSNFKAATFVQVSTQDSSEFHFVGEITSDLYQPIFFGIDPHLALHFMEHMGLGRWRLETRVWSEV